jgi:peptidoglycan/LPS O-acetylase OafA/YrhL
MVQPIGSARVRAVSMRHTLQPSPPHARRVDRLDGVRAIAALSVVCFHVWLYRMDRPRGSRTEPLDHVLFNANVGLICFFVLSGYLLYCAFAQAALSGAHHVAIGPYLRRRAARIVPAAWVCGAACLVLYSAVGYDSITPSPSELPMHALFLQNYSLSTMGHLNPVMWTLCVEVAFYALLPLVGRVALRLGPRRIGAQVTLVVALIAVSPAWNVLVLIQDWNVVAQRALPAYLGSFGIGMLVAVWAQQCQAPGRSRRPLGPWATAALLGAATVVVVGDAMCHENGWWLREGIFRESLLGPPVQRELVGHLGAATGFALLIAAARWGSGPAVGWLGWRPLAALGAISYGLYLWHLPLLLVMRHASLLPVALGPRLFVVLAVSVAAAAVSWRYIERPCTEHRWVGRGGWRDRVDERTPALVVGTAAQRRTPRVDATTPDARDHARFTATAQIRTTCQRSARRDGLR